MGTQKYKLLPKQPHIATQAEDEKWVFLTRWHQLAPGEPEPVGEYVFAPPRKFAWDWSWPSNRLAVEVDGGDNMVRYSPKLGRYIPVGAHTKDDHKEKNNLAVEMGWLVFHYSPQMLEEDPLGVVDQVRTTLMRLRDGKFQ